MQTSTVTVAVLQPDVVHRDIKPENLGPEIEIKTTKGSGPGGQARNKIESCVVVTHLPTGLSVRVDMRSQHQSKSVALQILAAKLTEFEAAGRKSAQDAKRRSQVGSGMRSDKIRTYREQDDQVTDHRTNRSWKLKAWRRGEWA